MDPNATMRAFRDALCDGDVDEATWFYRTMKRWLEGDGFLPTGFHSANDVLDHMGDEIRATNRAGQLEA